MTPHEFIKKWKPVALTERQTAQEHFIDLCRLVNHPTPVEDDPSGKRYCFEKGAAKSYGNPGFADVWKQGYFAFEYKKKKKNLGEALKQLSLMNRCAASRGLRSGMCEIYRMARPSKGVKRESVAQIQDRIAPEFCSKKALLNQGSNFGAYVLSLHT